MALDCLGYSRQDPVFARELDEFWRLAIEEEETMRMQPCFSPIWDTALAVFAAAESGLEATHPALRRGGGVAHLQTSAASPATGPSRTPPDSREGGASNLPTIPIRTWTTLPWSLLALSRVHIAETSRQRQSMRRGLEWVSEHAIERRRLGVFRIGRQQDHPLRSPLRRSQCHAGPEHRRRDGARVWKCWARSATTPNSARPAGQSRFLRQQQEADGSWFGRWGVNYIYGTCFALRGLAAIGVDMREAFCLRAAEWLRSFQNPDGGWGESCDSYDNPDLRGIGPSTAAQTSWALLGLFATGDFDSESVKRGVQFLLKTQKENGAWEDDFFTGTGFPRVFYLKYHLYSVYFPDPGAEPVLAAHARYGGNGTGRAAGTDRSPGSPKERVTSICHFRSA